MHLRQTSNVYFSKNSPFRAISASLVTLSFWPFFETRPANSDNTTLYVQLSSLLSLSTLHQPSYAIPSLSRISPASTSCSLSFIGSQKPASTILICLPCFSSSTQTSGVSYSPLADGGISISKKD